MKRFLLISTLFHSLALLLLFSWEVPSADRVFTRNIIEVSLVAEKEKKSVEKNVEEATPPPSKPAKKEKEKVSEIKKPLQLAVKKEEKREKPQEEIKTPVPVAAKEKKAKKKEEEILPAAKKEEKIEKPQEEIKTSMPVAAKEEKAKKEEEIHPEDKSVNASAAELSEGPVLAPVQRLSVASASGPPPPMDLDLGTGEGAGKERTRSAFFVPRTSSRLSEEAGPGKGSREPISEKGEGSPGPMSSIRGGSEGADPILMAIMRKIETAKRYPKTARRMGIEGTAKVRFKVRPNGEVEAIEIVESSGSEILDKASLETIREAAPLPYKEGWLKVGIVFKIL